MGYRTKMVHYKLIYFDGRGLAECARQLFALGDQPYEDVRLSKEQFASLKASLPFGQVPVLEVDGKQIAQSQAINRYLGRTFGLTGRDAIEDAIIDSLSDLCIQYINEITQCFYVLNGLKKGDIDKMKKETLFPVRDKYLGFVTNFLKENAKSG
ncbi:hypothetical protein KIN20_007656, partial [Parelaphostrongylus tenuis]